MQQPPDDRPHLRDIPADRLAASLAAAGFERADALAHRLGIAVHRDGALTWDDLGLAGIGRFVRASLSERFRFGPLLEVVGEREADDMHTRKWMLRLRTGEVVEAVAIRHWADHTLCVSTQAGCAMACGFCATGRLGLQRNLSPGEITEAVVHAQRAIGARITDIVFMGMGEPLHNFDATIAACVNLNHASGHGIARKRITISTSGLVREIRRMTAEGMRWRMHVSLHSAIQETRERIMPIARTNPLPDLVAAVRERQQALGTDAKWVTFQYVALPGVNMDDRHVDALGRELEGVRYILNVIPWNETDGPFRAPGWDEVKDFTTRLRRLGCPVKVRYSAGKQDGMGCGQLAAETIAVTPREGHMIAPPGIFTSHTG
ncbi:MAG: Dual-specificity RNA methyltransferase RlmN [Planctomycetes bacterium]|nr:Dual-specificity RNA methyltransferase RlmN [Planctomycetota bacterium]